MKHSLWGIGLGAALFILASCGPAKAPDQSFAVPEGQAEAPLELAADEAFILSTAAKLAPEAGSADGAPLALGTKVKVLSSEGTAWKVRTPEGTEGWVGQGSLAKDIRRAVLKADANGWETLTVVGYRPLAAEADQVEAVSAAANPADPVQTAKVSRSVLSLDVNDLNLAVLWQRARTEADPAAKTSLLTTALGKYSASQFASVVQAALDAQSGQASTATRPASLIVTAGDGGAKLWPTPLVGTGDPVALLAAGEQAQVVEETVDPMDRDGVKARWYKVADPAGWVFGADVKE